MESSIFSEKAEKQNKKEMKKTNTLTLDFLEVKKNSQSYILKGGAFGVKKIGGLPYVGLEKENEVMVQKMYFPEAFCFSRKERSFS